MKHANNFAIIPATHNLLMDKTMQKMISAALLVGGLILLYFGYQEMQSLGNEVNEFVTGSPSDRSIWMMGGGAAIAIAGLVGLVRGKLFK